MLSTGLLMFDDFLNPQHRDGSPLDPNEVEGLIPPINTYEELNAAEALNILDAIAWVTHRRRRLSTGIVLTPKWGKELHKKMYGDVWQWAGTYRTSQKNIGLAMHAQIPIELKKMFDNASVQIENMALWALSPQDIAVQLSHKAVWIHPFPNGNGRWSRLLANAFLGSMNEPIFTWGRTFGDDGEKQRGAYIKALKFADRGKLEALLKFAQM